MSIKTLSVQCPTCKKEVLMTPAFPERPFCSKRCKLIDLGEWASEGHRIAGEEIDPAIEDAGNIDRD
jgi:endogenous inhibitor of DNA gyrase (YacG/DUF329 family)